MWTLSWLPPRVLVHLSVQCSREGRGLNCSYAVYQDASGKAEEKTIVFGIGIGAGYLFKTTFQREATSDLEVSAVH